MKLNFKRLMAMLLSVMMVVSMLPTAVFATEATETLTESNYVAQVGDDQYPSLEGAFTAATETDTIVLLTDAAPALTSQKAITAASVIDLNGKTLTLTEDDLYFGTTTFKNGKIVVDPSVVSSTAVFWMFQGQTLTFDSVEIVATGVTGCYLIGTNGGTGANINLTNGSKITIANTEQAALTAVIAGNGTNDQIVINNSTINVSNIEGRVALGGSYTVSDSTITAIGVKEGFYIRANQTLSIEGTSNVSITLNSTEGRYGINISEETATYNKADTATVNASLYESVPAVTYVAEVDGTGYEDFDVALANADGKTVKLLTDVSVASATIAADTGVTINLNGKTLTMTPGWGEYAITVNGELTITGEGNVVLKPQMFVGYGIGAQEGGKLTINGGTWSIEGTSGVVASAYGELVVNGGSFTGPTNTSIFNTGDTAKVTITDGTFSHTPIEKREGDTRTVSISGGSGYTDSFDENWLADGFALVDGAVVQAATKAPSCTIGAMYMEDNGERIRVYGECNGVYAAESLVFKLYSGETLLATSSLNTTFPYETNELTVNIVLAGEVSGSWNNVLEDAVLSVDKMPTHAVVYVDGNEMATVNVQMNGPDGKAKIVAAVVENGKITKLVANTDYNSDFTAALNTAFTAGGNIVLMRDVTLTDTLTVPSGVTVTLDLNGKTISQSKECTESYSMIENNGSLTITGNGKISFTDTGAGDPTFGWGSYTIRNAGTLVVENGTVEHLGEQFFATHCIMAIFNYSGSTTINGGTISTPNYRSMRLWNGTMTINGGEIDGQVWVQTQSGEGATLNITGGSFSPNGNDGSSVYVTNDNNTISFSVTGGTFATKIGCHDAAALTGSKITGGTFSEAAVTAMGTDSALLAEGMTFTQNESGSYGVAQAPAEESWYDATATELVIDTPAELQEFAQITNGTHATIAKDTFSGKTVKLGADIDLSGITWTPIASFAGTFDGNNYTISNFKLDSTNADAGFFAYIGQYPATAKNLTLANVEAIAGANELGILAATAHTTVVNNVTIKNVKVTTENSNARVGGFFGYFNWTSAANSKLVNFEVDATMGAEFIGGYASFMDQNDDVGINNVDIEGFKVIVSDTDGNCEVGGFTGQTQTGWRDPLFQNCDVTGIDITATGTVTVGGFVANPGAHTRATNCTTEGKINATGVTDPSNYIGGFFGNAGWNDDLGSQGGHKLTNCSADVDIITGGAAAGGFIGSATNDNNANMPIAFTECKAKGTITVADGATANIGGFAGEADRGTYTDCTAAQTPFIGGTPTNVEIESTSWYDAEATELIIDTPEELVEFAQIVNGTHATFAQDTFTGKTVKLGADIDLSSVANWTPIGNGTNYFWGTFDGGNHTISNMTIDMESTGNVYAGLFGSVKKATIKNLVIKDASINAVGAKAYVGAVVGQAHSNSENHTTANLNFENITVDGCTINAESKSASIYVGGFVGYCYPANMTNISVSNLTLNPKATGSVFAGGLVGYMQGQNISNNGNTRAYYTVDTFNLKNITINSTTQDSLIGGFAGYTYYGYITLKNATIDGFKVDADVTKEALVGGLIGLAHRSDNGHTFTDVEITGIDFDVVSDSGYDVILGGMVGYSGSPIAYSDCSASGTITETTRSTTSSAFVGGFVGQVASWSPSFTNCSADVTLEAATNSVGGFAGCVSSNSSYTNCSATTDPFIGYYYSGALTNNGSYVASVGTEYYANFANALAAANATEGGATVTLLADVVLSEMLTITGTVTLDLNGKTITGTDNTEKNFGLISVNKGNLTVNDSVGTGKITLTATVDSDWSRYSAVIANNQGTVTVNGGTIEHLGGTDMAYGIDNLTNGTIGDAALTVTGGTVKSTYRAIRQFLNSTSAQNILTVNGGTIEGANKSIWVQNANANNNPGTLKVSNAATLSGDVLLSGSSIAGYWTLEVSVAAAALQGESTVILSKADAYVVKETSGTWSVDIAPSYGKVAKISDTYYEKLSDAITAANANDTIVLLANVTEDVTIDKNLTIDGANFNYTGTMTISKSINLTIDKVNFVGGYIVKGKDTGTSGTYTITNCTFKTDSTDKYAVEIRGSSSIIIENCSSDGYYGFLQVPSSNNGISIKNVAISNTGYAIKVDYSNGVSLESVSINNSTYGFVNSNYGAKTITVKNCSILATYPLVIWDRNTAKVNTFKFEGINDFGTSAFYYQAVTEEEMAYTKYVLTAADATLTAVAGLDVTTSVENSVVKYDNGSYKVVKTVAKIGDQYYETVADALKAAADGATIELIYAEGDAPIAMNGYVSGKTVTITGTAQVNWEKGFLFVGRTNDGTAADNATLIFDNATLTTTQGGDHGIHVSGAEKGSATKANGTVKLVNSTINLSYLINKGNMTLDNSTLTVKSGFSIGGRPANETVSGEDATATISLTNGSKVVVDNHNGMGLGYEAIGVMNIDATSSFETTKSFLVTAKGTMNLAGKATIAGTLTNNGSIVLTDAAATLTSSECGKVTTDVAGYEVTYANGKYALTKVEEVETPITFANAGHNLRLQDLIKIGFYFTATPAAEKTATEVGAYIWAAGTDEASALKVVATYNSETGKYTVESNGIKAQELDVMYYAKYYAVIDGVEYSDVVDDYAATEYLEYVYNYYTSGDLLSTRSLVIDLANYAAMAQTYFALSNDAEVPEQLINSFMDDADKTLNWSDDLKRSNPTVSKSTSGGYNATWGGANVNLVDALSLSFIVNNTDVEGVIYWTQADYEANSTLSYQNKSGEGTTRQGLSGGKNSTFGTIPGLYSFNIYDNYYAAMYKKDGDNYLYSDVYGRSIASYASYWVDYYASATAEKDVALRELCKAMLIYGNNAETYFD